MTIRRSKDSTSGDQIEFTPPNIEDLNVRSNSEQPYTTTLTLRSEVASRSVRFLRTEFHMTIQSRTSELTTKQASILLKVCSVRALLDGLDLTLYMSMEFLLSFLTKQFTIPPEEIFIERDRQSALLADLILRSFRGEWINVGERIRLDDHELYEAVSASGWLPSKRTYNSWLSHWEPDRWLEFRIVPVEHILSRPDYYEAYSSYTKGYKDGGTRSRKKTRYTSELDGEPWKDTEPPEFNLLEVQSYQRILSAIESLKARRVQGR
jgi:hypothetical protein